MMTGIDMVHVPYRGSAPALTDLLAGQVQVMFDAMPSSIEYIRVGRVHRKATSRQIGHQVIKGDPSSPGIGGLPYSPTDTAGPENVRIGRMDHQ